MSCIRSCPKPMGRSSIGSSFGFRSQSSSASRSRSSSRGRSRSNFRSSRVRGGSGRVEVCANALACLTPRVGDAGPETERLSEHAIALRDWIISELPPIEMPDDDTLEDLLTGNGRAIFEYLVSRVVKPERAIQLRSAIALERGDSSSAPRVDEDEVEILQKQGDAIEQEIMQLRARIRAASKKKDDFRLGLTEEELRTALIDAAVGALDEGTAVCQKYAHFLHNHPFDSKSTNSDNPTIPTVDALRDIVTTARMALSAAHGTQSDHTATTTNNGDNIEQNDSAKLFSKLNADIEHICQSFTLEQLSTAVESLSAESDPRQRAPPKDPVSESAEDFAKLISNQLQDEYLQLFAETQRESGEKGDKEASVEREECEDDASEDEAEEELAVASNTLEALDHALTELTEGSRERITRMMRDVKHMDMKQVGPLQARLKEAHTVQHTRLRADMALLRDAQQASLVELMHPPICTVTEAAREGLEVDAAERILFNVVRSRQASVRRDVDNRRLRRLQTRARTEADRRAKVESDAKERTLPLLEKAANAAKHAHDRTVPAATSEVAMATKVDAFVAARTEQRG